MAAIPILSTLLTQGIGTLSRFLRPGLPNAVGPNLAGLRSQIAADINSRSAKNALDVKQIAAAGRAPSAAVSDSLTGINRNATRQLTGALSRIVDSNQFAQQLNFRRALAQQQGFDNFINFTNSGVSALGHILALEKAGLLDSGITQPDSAQVVQDQQALDPKQLLLSKFLQSGGNLGLNFIPR